MSEQNFEDDVQLAMIREICLLWYNLSLSQNHPPEHAKSLALSRAKLILRARGSITLNQKINTEKYLHDYLDKITGGTVPNPLFTSELQ